MIKVTLRVETYSKKEEKHIIQMEEVFIKGDCFRVDDGFLNIGKKGKTLAAFQQSAVHSVIVTKD